jgi:Zn-finger nucleic acid-binding protein
METVELRGVEVDRCTNCRGIWFDVGESELLREEGAAAAIDSGDPRKGIETNVIDRYRCPRCGGGMMRSLDPRHAQITYEECTSCRGLFFDAGEFAELTRKVGADFLQRRASPKRHS